MSIIRKALLVGLLGVSVLPISVSADERNFTYSYEADVLPEGKLEFEQWMTAKVGRQNGDYARWEFREELEYGLTNNLTTAVYLNFEDTYSSGVEGQEDTDKMKFKGISSEWKYKLTSPDTDLIGSLLYGEVTVDGDFVELEGKTVFSKNLEDWVFALNGILEAKWEFEDGDTEKETELYVTAGAAYKLCSSWSVGLEGRHKRKYADGILDFSEQDYTTWSLGPVVKYGAPSWWAAFTILPQIHGNGEGSEDNLQLTKAERVEARLLVGILF